MCFMDNSDKPAHVSYMSFLDRIVVLFGRRYYMRTVGLVPLREPFRRRNLLRFPVIQPFSTAKMKRVENSVLLSVAATKNRMFYPLQLTAQGYVWDVCSRELGTR